MSEDNVIIFNFALVNAVTLVELVSTPAGDWEKLGQLLAQVVVQWPEASDPSDPVSYASVNVPLGLSIVQALQNTVAAMISKPKILKRVLIEKWTMPEFVLWNKALTSGQWGDTFDLLKKVSKEFDPETTNGEDLLMLIGSVAQHVRSIGAQGN